MSCVSASLPPAPDPGRSSTSSSSIHARPELQEKVDGLIVSWGYGGEATFLTRSERQGTRDPSAYLTVWTAIDGSSERLARCAGAVSRLTRRARSRLCGLEDRADRERGADRADGKCAFQSTTPMRSRGASTTSGESRCRCSRARPSACSATSVAAYTEERDLEALADALDGTARSAPAERVSDHLRPEHDEEGDAACADQEQGREEHRPFEREAEGHAAGDQEQHASGGNHNCARRHAGHRSRGAPGYSQNVAEVDHRTGDDRGRVPRLPVQLQRRRLRAAR